MRTRIDAPAVGLSVRPRRRTDVRPPVLAAVRVIISSAMSHDPIQLRAVATVEWTPADVASAPMQGVQVGDRKPLDGTPVVDVKIALDRS